VLGTISYHQGYLLATGGRSREGALILISELYSSSERAKNLGNNRGEEGEPENRIGLNHWTGNI
jgi:hypothetical protein